MKLVIYFILYNLLSISLLAQVVPYSDAFLREAKMSMFKGKITLPARSKSFLDKEENRIQSAKRILVLQMLSYYRYKRKIAMDPRLEEMLVMDTPKYLLKNFEITEVNVVNIPKSSWNQVPYFNRFFAYRCEYDEYLFYDYLSPFYQIEENYYSIFGKNAISEKERKSFDKQILERKEIGSLFQIGETFMNSILEEQLKRQSKYYSKTYKDLFGTLIKNQKTAERLYAQYSLAIDKSYSLTDEEAEYEDYIRKRLENTNSTIYERETIREVQTTKDRKGLSTAEKAIIIGALKGRSAGTGSGRSSGTSSGFRVKGR